MMGILGARKFNTGLFFCAVLLLALTWSVGHVFAGGSEDVSKGCPSGCQAVTNNPASYYDIWVPLTLAGTTVTVDVDPLCVSGMGFTAYIVTGGTGGPWDHSGVCGSGGTQKMNVTFGGSSGNCQITEPNKQYCSVIFEIHVSSVTSGATGHFPYNIYMDSASNGNIGFAGQDPTVLGTSPSPNQTTPAPLAPAWHSFGEFSGGGNFSFRANCKSSGTVYFGWSGVDYGASWQSLDVYFKITDITTGLPIFQSPKYDDQGIKDPSYNAAGDFLGWAGYSNFHAQGIPIISGHQYSWHWYNNSSTNELVYTIPFSGNSFVKSTCTSWNLYPHSSVPSTPLDPVNNKTAIFTHWVHNAGPDTAKFDWHVEGKYIRADGTVLGWSSTRCGDNPYGTPSNGIVSQTGIPAYGPPSPPGCPSSLSYGNNDTISPTQTGGCPNGTGGVGNTNCKYETYQFPNDAVDGDQYCQRMVATNATGPSTGDGYSQGGCVIYHTLNGPNAAISGDCNGALFNVGRAHLAPGDPATNLNVRYALYETPVGSAGLPSYPAPSTQSSATGYPNVTNGNINASVTNAPSSVHYYSLLNGNQTSSGNVQWQLVTYNIWTTGSGTSKVYYTGINSVVTTPPIGPCYTASCSVTVLPGVSPWGNNDFMGNQQFQVSVSLYNSGVNTISNPLSSSYPYYPSATTQLDGGGPTPQFIGEDLLSGQPSTPQIYTVTAPADASPHTITAYADYWGRGPLTPPGTSNTCSTTFNSFEHFNITGNASATLSPFSEDPTQVNKQYTVSNAEWPAPATANMYLYDNPPNTTQFSGSPVEAESTSDTYGNPPPYNYTYNLGSWQGGEQYCPQINISPSVGWIGPGNAMHDQADQTFNGNCAVITNDPYFKAFNSGVKAGGDFSCNNPPSGGKLASWNNNRGTYPDFGASADFSAEALNTISGFGSAQTNFGRSPTDLTFANIGVPIGANNYSAPMGGNFGGLSCLTDYTQGFTKTTINPDLNSNPTTGPSQIDPGTYQSINVVGDVYITNNVVYNTGAAWNLSNVPSFVLHASGDIYIDPSVTRLDGWYVSDKKDGHIYTCSNAPGGFPKMPMPPTDLYNKCNKQLTVYGSFVADHVSLMRTYGSLRDEKPISTSSNNSMPFNPVNGPQPQGYIMPPNSPTATFATTLFKIIIGSNQTFYGTKPYGTQSTLVGYISASNLSDGSTEPLYIGNDTSGKYCVTVTPSSSGCNVSGPSSILGYVYKTNAASFGPPPSPLNCNNTPPGYVPGSSQTCAAEVFYLSPEMYLSNPGSATSSQKFQHYDAITSLPPVL